MDARKEITPATFVETLEPIPAVTPLVGPAVYRAIAAVSAELAKAGIAKTGRNQQQGYAFRGIDAVYNALAPILAAHDLVILPRMLRRELTERTTAKGGVLFAVVVEAEFDFVSAVDGSRHVVRTFGEAMDSADKATNKAMSAAYKYAAFQAFCIPTEGDNDADATTHVVVAEPAPRAKAAPDGFEDWIADLEAVSAEGEARLKAAWLASAVPFRQYLTVTDMARWEGIKAKAQQHSEVPA